LQKTTHHRAKAAASSPHKIACHPEQSEGSAFVLVLFCFSNCSSLDKPGIPSILAENNPGSAHNRYMNKPHSINQHH
jgi:hypothetical protein